ncbi:aminotransferase class V-fold PLP-dependent enzyme [Pedobacter changchengzhani]|uniref:Aminotransferase class V-fold PLP-dependent enzyme n=1 Tax=Pedobacter changchengzhani TaxID=2529274 RepID=A0A4R5MLA2_9SPHI|nr:aminotransferase class V-fold PLP-dependent enzyme [Pedobacter changchengzhani]TDG36005.1 aminotransferase class V-fold PLP-dependent enzyme [Pedobacter changchengzhani]
MTFENTFPILNRFTYLNTAYSGLLSIETAKWRHDHDALFLNGASNFRIENGSILDELRSTLARFFITEPAQVYLVPNFSFGFNTLIGGLTNSHRFLLLKEDYPNINNEVISNGFPYFEVEINDELEAEIIDAIHHFKPTIFALSLVQYISGFKINLEFIKKLKSTYPDLLIVADGTQFCGTEKFSFENSGLDALVGSGYKWLLGGYGNGYVLLSNQMKKALYEARAKVVILNNLYGKDYLSMRFEPGHLDTLNFGTLNEGIKYLESIGIDYIEKRIQELSQKARMEFCTRGLLTEKNSDADTQSPIINLPISKLTDAIENEKILCSQRGTGLRFAFHFYNTEKDLTKLLSVIDQYL